MEQKFQENGKIGKNAKKLKEERKTLKRIKENVKISINFRKITGTIAS